MALKGIKVIEMAGLAPGPHCGMILSDFGASVVRVDKVGGMQPPDVLSRGKRSIVVNIKQQEGVDIVTRLCRKADVLIEPYRKGVMEKLGLGPDKLAQLNPRLVYARLTGFGQSGPYSERAGHDINYLALSGVLSKLGKKGSNPEPPVNLLADFAGGGLTCALGIAMALYERERSHQGQVIDCSMVEGAAYLSSFLWKSRSLHYFVPVWGKERGDNVLDGGSHFYTTYRTKDGKYMAVGALEPQFYSNLVKGLKLEGKVSQIGSKARDARALLAEVFLSKTQDEWTAIFDTIDACVTPILDLDDAHLHPHSASRESFIRHSEDGSHEPRPAPLLSRTPASVSSTHLPVAAENTIDVLREYGFESGEISGLLRDGIVKQSTKSML